MMFIVFLPGKRGKYKYKTQCLRGKTNGSGSDKRDLKGIEVEI